MAENELPGAGSIKSFIYRHAPTLIQDWMQDRAAVQRITAQLERDAQATVREETSSAPSWDRTSGTFAKPDERPDLSAWNDRPPEAPEHDNTVRQDDRGEEPDYAALSELSVREAFEHRDTTNDYAEAYADVAGDPTLSWRLEEESPIDILADVKRQVHEGVFGKRSIAPDTTKGFHYIGADDPKPPGWGIGSKDRDDDELER